jgi:ribosomal protein S18 acetylase RimI-like enzyme
MNVKFCKKSKKTYNFISKYLTVYSFEDYISNKNLYQACCYDRGKLVGVRIFRMKDSKIHLNYTAILEEYRRKGLNGLLFDKILRLAYLNNVTLITVNVRKSNKESLSSLFKSGFKVNKKIVQYYPDGEKKIALFYSREIAEKFLKNFRELKEQSLPLMS